LIPIPDAVREFIHQHANDDVRQLVLSHQQIAGVPISWVAQQIGGRQKAKDKLPLWFASDQIIFPPTLNLEQCSSEATARFKQDLFTGKLTRGVDLTGGFGVDCFYLAPRFQHFDYVDGNSELLEIARNNHRVLQANNITHHHTSAESFLCDSSAYYDLVYIDPSRRTTKGKVFRFRDCEPGVVALMPTLRSRAGTILIKASPMIDIQQGIEELQGVSEVFVVSVDGECKEVLFLIANAASSEPTIHAVNISGGLIHRYSFLRSEEKAAEVLLNKPQAFLYEPNASILKAGAFKKVAADFGVQKVHVSTHLYTATELVSDFPGRKFRIVAQIRADDKDAALHLREMKANVMTRNYPLSADELKKKMKIGDGGDLYIIGFTGVDKKYVVVASRV